MTITPGTWSWWTSNSWRRLRSDQSGGITRDVLMPHRCRDGQLDIVVSEGDMALIAAAPRLLAALEVAMPLLCLDVEGCLDCDWGQGSTGKDECGAPCRHCADQRVALEQAQILVREIRGL